MSPDYDTLSANSRYIEYAWILTFLTRIAWPGITWNALRGETGPDGLIVFGHTDVWMIFFVNANTCKF